MKKFFKEYFTFTPKERLSVIVLIIVIGIVLLLPYIYPYQPKKINTNPELDKAMAELMASDTNETPSNNYKKYNNETPITHYELFRFNPNTLDEKGWERLGISAKTIRTILNYLSKGGKFKTSEDIRKIWGLSKEDADRIIPYAVIPEEEHKNAYTNNYSKATKPPQPIDINTATLEDWKILPNIGYSVPYHILNYRTQKGSFFTIEQIKSVYGMTDTIYQSILPYLRLKPETIQKININTATEFQLTLIPNLNKTIARAIIIYREQHGLYQNKEDIKKIIFIKNEVFEQIAPYIKVN